MKEQVPGDVWRAVLGDLQLQVTAPTYNTWLKDTRGVALERDLLTVGVPSPFAAEWLESRMYQLIQKTINRVTSQSLEVCFQVGNSDQPGSITEGSSSPVSTQYYPLALNQRYTFNSFVVGPSNRLAYNAANSVVESPGQRYNPLFIRAGVGLGKTHLLHAVAHTCIGQGLRPLYVTSEQFTNEFITALRHRTTEEFRSRYRRAQVLLIDDIHFMGGKERTLESFFHTFNDLHNTSCQIIMTSDRLPHSLAMLGDPLRSRMEWGLIADIQPPDLETRKAILRTKAAQIGASVPEEVVHIIAFRAHKNVRELEGYLNRIVAYSHAVGAPITPALASQALAGVLSSSNQASIPPQRVIEEVSSYFNLSVDTLQGAERTKQAVRARHIAMYILRQEFKIGLKTIASLMLRSNHTTVLHAISKLKEQLRTDPDLTADISSILRGMGLYISASA